MFLGLSHPGCALLLVTGLELGAALWGAVLYLPLMLATTAIHHRLLAHRSCHAPLLVWWRGSLHPRQG